jgi:hypothetical protein
MESLKFHPGPPCPTPLCPAGHREGSLRLFSIPLDIPRHMPMLLTHLLHLDFADLSAVRRPDGAHVVCFLLLLGFPLANSATEALLIKAKDKVGKDFPDFDVGCQKKWDANSPIDDGDGLAPGGFGADVSISDGGDDCDAKLGPFGRDPRSGRPC